MFQGKGSYINNQPPHSRYPRPFPSQKCNLNSSFENSLFRDCHFLCLDVVTRISFLKMTSISHYDGQRNSTSFSLINFTRAKCLYLVHLYFISLAISSHVPSIFRKCRIGAFTFFSKSVVTGPTSLRVKTWTGIV